MCSVTLRGRFLGIPTLKEMTSLAETGLSSHVGVHLSLVRQFTCTMSLLYANPKFHDEENI